MSPKEILVLRKALSITQQQLADRIGAQRHTIARWELGQNQPRGANLKGLRELQERIKTKANRKRK
jgi:DNA-binding transcriptional regulator YiaG